MVNEENYFSWTSFVTQETIFAPATGAVKAGVAILRLSGPHALHALQQLIGKDQALPKSHHACLRRLYEPDSNLLLDTALILFFRAPHSFTGEDIVELHVHGSRAILQSVLSVLSSLPGLRPALAGEFAKRAFLHGKMDLTQAEGLADLIDAETSRQAQLAQRHLAGELQGLYHDWRNSLIRCRAQLEAYIDFPDEDIPSHVTMDIRNIIDSLQNDIATHIDSSKAAERLRSGLVVALVGAPNVGKSSLLNRFANRDVALVSPHAGTTRDSLETHLDIHGYPIMVIDTAGLRETSDSVEQMGISRTIERAKNADIILFVTDHHTGFDHMHSHKFLPVDHAKTMVVWNKNDEHPLPTTAPNDCLAVSAKTGEAIDTLLQQLHEHAASLLDVPETPVFTRQRHKHLLEETLTSLNAISLSDLPEIAAEQLRAASHSLGSITGNVDVEDVLDALFSQFCIGK